MNKIWTIFLLFVVLFFGDACQVAEHSNTIQNIPEKGKSVNADTPKKINKNTPTDRNILLEKMYKETLAILNKPAIITPKNEIICIVIEEIRGNYISDIRIDRHNVTYTLSKKDSWYISERFIKQDNITGGSLKNISNNIIEFLSDQTFVSKRSDIAKGVNKYLLIRVYDANKTSTFALRYDWNELDKNDTFKIMKSMIVRYKLDKWIWSDFIKE